MEAIAILEDLAREGEVPESGKRLHQLYPKSKKFPPLYFNFKIDLFVKPVSEEFRKILPAVVQDNLSRSQRKAFRELKKMKDVVLEPADNGVNNVICPVKMYEKEAFRQLRNTKVYKKLMFNPLSSFQDAL